MRVTLFLLAAALCSSSLLGQTVPASLTWPRNPDSQVFDLDTLPSCGSTAALGDGSIGVLSASGRLDQLLLRCPRVIPGFRMEEGDWYPVVTVRLGRAIVTVELSDTSHAAEIARFITTDSLVRTADGIGVGSTLQDLEDRYGQLSFDVAECAIYVWPQRLRRVAWIIAFPAGWDCSRAERVASPGSERPPPSSRLVVTLVGPDAT